MKLKLFVALISLVISSSSLFGQGPRLMVHANDPVLHPRASATSGILLFNGTGTSNSVQGLESVMTNLLSLTYDTANTAQLNAMTATQFKAYRLFIVPGGDSIIYGNTITKAAAAMVQHGVKIDGVRYLGVCAGAFYAGSDSGGTSALNLTGGVYYNLKPGEPDPASIIFTRTSAGGGNIDLYFDDGPTLKALSGITWGNVVAKFPEGDAAIVEKYSGTGTLGWTILAAMHTEAFANWETGMTFTTTIAVQNAYSATLINAALNGTSLPHF